MISIRNPKIVNKKVCFSGSTSFDNNTSKGSSSSRKLLSRDPALSHLVNGDRSDTTTTLVSEFDTTKSIDQDTWRNKPRIQVQGVSPKSGSAPIRFQHPSSTSNDPLTIQGERSFSNLN